MSEYYIKAMQWFALMLLVVLGSWAFFWSSHYNDMRPVMIGVVSYGFVFVVGTYWKVFKEKVLLFTILILISSAFGSRYLPYYLYVYTGIVLDYHYAAIWTGLLFIPGVPLMAYVFKKYS